ncbi:MAG: metallophosphoesterase [Thermodesulfovibrionales bacterium]|nr:metallophosphoesterase [Thermodesulfovibrionales bacterium]
MLIGILADTHDNQPMTKKAVEFFNARNVGYVIHAGDFTSPFTLKLFKELKCKYVGIFGNNDGDKLLLQDRAEGNIKNQPHTLTLNGKRIVVVHEHHIVNALADSGHYDIVIYGHTHEPVVKKVKDTLLINPGEVCGWLYGKSTAALLDLNTMQAEIIEL